jgi:hypothetical protein
MWARMKDLPESDKIARLLLAMAPPAVQALEVVARLVRQRTSGQAGGITSRQVCGLATVRFEHAQGVVSGPTESKLAGCKFLQGVLQILR